MVADKLHNQRNEGRVYFQRSGGMAICAVPRRKGIGDVQENPRDAGSLRERIREATRRIDAQIIMEALVQHRWNRRRTAEALRISYRSLMYKMKNCNLRDEKPRTASSEAR